MSKKLILGVAVIGLVGAGGYVLLQQQATQKAEAAVAAYQESLPAEHSFSYQGVEADLLSQGARLSEVAFSLPGAEGMVNGTAAQLSISDPTVEGGKLVSVGGVSFETLELSQADGSQVIAESGSLEDVKLGQSGGIESLRDIGAISLTGVQARDAKRDGGVRFASLNGDGFTRGALSSLEVTGLEIDGTDPKAPFDRLQAARLEVAGADFAALMALQDREVAPGSPEMMRALMDSRLEGLRIEDLLVTRGGEEVARMGAAQVSLVSRDGWLEFDAEINDQTMQVARSEPYGDLADYGYQQVSGDSAARIRFNPEAGELEIATLSGSVDEVFGYEIAGKMVGIPKPGARMDPKSVALAEASVSFTNHGVVERLLAHQAEQKGMPVARFTEIQAAQAEQMGQRRGVAATGKKVADFIRDPDSLTLSMSPERPMGFQELMMRAMMQPRSLEQAAGLRLAVNQ